MFPNSVDQQVPDWRRRMPNWGGPPPTVTPPIPQAQQPPMVGDGPGPPVSAMGPEPAGMPPAYTPPPSSPMTGQAPDPVVEATAPATRLPAAPPPVKAAAMPEQDRLREMVQAGPKRSVLGTLAGLGVRAAAGWASSPGRPPQVNAQRLEDWAERSPDGNGSWREGMARQGQLAGMEQGDVARSQAAAKAASDQAHVQSQIELAKKQGGYYDAHGEAVKQGAATAAATEKDRVNTQTMDRNLKLGVAGARVLKDGEQPPPDTYTFKDEQGRTVSVPSKTSQDQEQITLAEAKAHGIAPNQQEMESGRVSVDRRLYGHIVQRDKAAPEPKSYEEWNAYSLKVQKGSPEWTKAQEAMKNLTSHYQTIHPHVPSDAAGDRAAVRQAKAYVGGLQQTHNNDWKKIQAAITADAAISPGLRAEASAYAAKMERQMRDPKAKRSLVDMYGAPKGPPPVNGGGRGSPQPQAADPAGVRQFLR